MIDLWTQEVVKIYEALNGRMRLAGGCVRDYLLNQMPCDIDMATPLLPNEVMTQLKRARITTYPIARGHGVVGAEMSGQVFEITTLRQDVYSDLGQEKIHFITDYRTDAVRRDFTINALYLDRQNTLYDYVGGQEDLKNRCVRFIGDPFTRMKEDPLRMFRYIRFWAQYGAEYPDEIVMGAFPELRAQIQNISTGRLCKEFLKILMCNRVIPAVELMNNMKMTERLIARVNTKALKELLNSCPNADSWTRLKVLSDGDIMPIWHVGLSQNSGNRSFYELQKKRKSV